MPSERAVMGLVRAGLDEDVARAHERAHRAEARGAARPALESDRMLLFSERYRFSRRESEILGLLVKGVHLKGIGELVGSADSSVRTHLRRMYKKVGCSNARELAIRFFSDPIADWPLRLP